MIMNLSSQKLPNNKHILHTPPSWICFFNGWTKSSKINIPPQKMMSAMFVSKQKKTALQLNFQDFFLQPPN